MMGNTSATGGYITPQTGTGPTKSAALLAFFQGVIVGITGLTSTLVRPAYQKNQPTRPDIDTNWAAFRIAKITPDYSASSAEQSAATLTTGKHELIDVFVSFYGPDCMDYADRLDAGLDIGQNREALAAAYVAYQGASSITHLPEEFNERFYDRADMTITFKRQARRVYDIFPILGSSVQITADDAHDTPLEKTFSYSIQYAASASPFVFDSVDYSDAGIAFIHDGAEWLQTIIFESGEAHPDVVIPGLTAIDDSLNVYLLKIPVDDSFVYYTAISNAGWAELKEFLELDDDPVATGLGAYSRSGEAYIFVMPDLWAVCADTETDTWTRPPTITKELITT
jgi:hypothetical protein